MICNDCKRVFPDKFLKVPLRDPNFGFDTYEFHNLETLSFKLVNYVITGNIFNPFFLAGERFYNGDTKNDGSLIAFVFENKRIFNKIITENKNQLISELVNSFSINHYPGYDQDYERADIETSKIINLIEKVITIEHVDSNASINNSMNFSLIESAIFEAYSIFDYSALEDIGTLREKIKTFCKSNIDNREIRTFRRFEALVEIYFYKCAQLNDYFKDCVLFFSKEMYDFIYGYLKALKVCGEETFSTNVFDHIFSVLYELITKNQINEDNLGIISKFYYLSIFFKNKLPNMECLENYGFLNLLSGFDDKTPNSNVTILREEILKEIFKYSNEEVMSEFYDIYSETPCGKVHLIESSLYLYEILRELPIFTGMELTPIVVDFFKSVEEIISFIFEKTKVEVVSFNERDVHLEVGSYNLIIKLLNCGQHSNEKYSFKSPTKFEIYNNESNEKTFNARKSIINDFLVKTQIEQYIERIKEAKIKNDCHRSLTDIKQSNSFSDILFNLINLWRHICRNSFLHKDNMVSKKRTRFSFEFTCLVLASITEWYLIVSKNKA